MVVQVICEVNMLGNAESIGRDDLVADFTSSEARRSYFEGHCSGKMGSELQDLLQFEAILIEFMLEIVIKQPGAKFLTADSTWKPAYIPIFTIRTRFP